MDINNLGLEDERKPISTQLEVEKPCIGIQRKRALMVCCASLALCLLFVYNFNLVKEPEEKWLVKQEEIAKKSPLPTVFRHISCMSSNGDKRPASSFTPIPSVDCMSMPQSGYLFCKAGADPMERAMDLVNRLTIEELIGQTSTIAPAIPRLGINDYNWRSNCLHGWSESNGNWGDSLKWTVFPAPIGLAATFDTELIRVIGGITGTEGRALHNELLIKFKGSSTEAAGLNCFSPNVNLFRDPRWGRGQETFGEDPLLISAMGVGYTKGLQEGPDKRFLLVAACAKHFAVHSGPETLRLEFIANTSMYDLYYSYLPAFKSQVMGAKVAQMMPALSGLQCDKQRKGAPDVANPFLLKSVLRDEFGAPNISICSDNGALKLIVTEMHYAKTFIDAAAFSMNASNDLDLGHDLVFTHYLGPALDKGLVTLESIRQAVTRSFYLRMLVGDFDPLSKVPYQSINKNSLDTESSRKINLKAAQESIVLLKNLMNALPINEGRIKHLVVLGPNANNSRSQLSNYQGIPSRNVTILQGIKDYLRNSPVRIDYASGCDDILCRDKSNFQHAESLVNMADYVIMVMGLSGMTEGEGLDRVQTACNGQPVPLLGLPGCQKDLVDSIVNLNAHVVLVLVNGGPLSIPDLYINRGVVGIVEAFYPGALGGTAVADVLFGAYNPSGKMPVSVYVSEHDLPPFVDYNMRPLYGSPGRTYRYSTIEPLIPFGFGLSYVDFKYTGLVLSKSVITPCSNLKVDVTLQNESPHLAGDEIVQLYLVPVSVPVSVEVPAAIATKANLIGFKRVDFPPKTLKSVSFEINPYLMSYADANGVLSIYPGEYAIQAGIKHKVKATFSIDGDVIETSKCSNAPVCLACE